jgi:hypothetical protein
MSAKSPRRTFAAPLVITLAVPACLVSSGKSSTPPPAGSRTADHRTDESRPHVNPPPVVGQSGTPAPDSNDGGGTGTGVIANPPPPDRTAPPTTGTATPPPRAPQPGNTTVQQTQTQTTLRSWHVFQNAGTKTCSAVLDVSCEKGMTCNPPPPTKVACPSALSMPQGATIKEEAAGSCTLYYPLPDCPAGMACNPPRPQTIGCPK